VSRADVRDVSQAPGRPRTAVLLSAGLDSAVLAADEAGRSEVHPIYVRTGMAWEQEELAILARLLATPPLASLVPLVTLDLPVTDVYPPTHWAIRGAPPGFDTPDEDVYLTGRNITLLAKASIHCALRGIGRIALGPLAGNPFPDATPEFFATMARALSLGLAHELRIDTPFAALRKADVIRLGRELAVPLELTLSCMNPRAGLHCGQCSKCRERRDAFREARVEDPTSYAMTPVR
jgi:7-cyano-7-deazaguanine synthase